MKLLFIIDSLGSGGAQRQMVQLALGLTTRGHKVEFFVYFPEYDFFVPTLKKNGIRIIRASKKRRFSTEIITSIRRLIQISNYDVILSFLDTPNFYAEIARLGLKKPALVVSERNAYEPQHRSLSKKLMDQFHRFADFITVNSYYQAAQMKKHSPWMHYRLVVIYNGLQLENFRPQKFDLNNKATILSVGSIIPRKNVRGLANALVEYHRAYDSSLSIAWAGALYSEKASTDEYKETNQILKSNNLENHWIWLGECHNMNEIYPQYPALIHPSFQEGLSNAICEAMACGLPLLLSNFGEHQRLINNNQNGRLFDPRSPIDIAQKINEILLLETNERKSMSDAVHKFARRELGFDSLVENYETLFLSLV